MRPLKPAGRAEPSLTRASQPERAYPGEGTPPLRSYAEEPVLRRAALTAAPEAPSAPEHREPAKAFARLEPSLRSAQPKDDFTAASAPAPSKLFSAPPPVLAEPPAQSAAPREGAAPSHDPEPAAPRKRIGIPLRWLETRAETRARKEREQQEAADLAAMEVYSAEPGPAADQVGLNDARAPSAPLRFGDAPGADRADPLWGERSFEPNVRAEPSLRADPTSRAETTLRAEPNLRADPGFATQSHNAAVAWVGAAPQRAPREMQPSVIASAQMQAPSLAPYQPSGSPAAAKADDVWTPVLPGHAPLRAEPSVFRSPDLAPVRSGRPIPVFGASAEAASGAWPKDPGLARTQSDDLADDDEDDVPFRPWLSLGRQADGRQVAVPGPSGSGILLARPGQQATGENSSLSGPWQSAQSAESRAADEPGWDRFYVESESRAESAPSFAAFYADDDASDAPLRSTHSAPAAAYTVTPAYTESAQAFSAPTSVALGGAIGFAAESDAPEAPMIEARSTRRDPAPSRTAYRLQRLWLTPLYRALLRKGLPAFVVVFAIGLALKDEGRREALVTWASDLRATITERPEFMLAELKIDGASPETEQALRAVLDVQFPVSSFDLELPILQAKASEVAAVASAALHVRSGGVLEVLVEERKPVVVWRSETGIGTLDPTGHQVASLQNRLERPDLPLIVGLGAEAAVPEALRLYHAAGPIRDRVRGLIRVGERRWDLIVDPAIRVMLPAKDPVPALEQVVALHEAQVLLDRDITAVDLRNPARATVRMGSPAAETWRLNLAAQKGKVTQ